MSNQRDELRTAIGREVCNAMNFPPEVIPHLLGRDLSKAIEAITGSVWSAGYRKSPEPTPTPEPDTTRYEADADNWRKGEL